jgi:hypothetical protein
LRNHSDYKRTKNYFQYKLGFTEQAVKEVLTLFACDTVEPFKSKQDRDKICKIIQCDWNSFMQWWGCVKHLFKEEYFKVRSYSSVVRKRKFRNRQNSEWNYMSEFLQYTNGSADDF